MLTFSTEHLAKVFANEDKYKNFKKLCHDLNTGADIYEYDEEGNAKRVSKHEANKAIRKVLLEVCELDEDSVKSSKLRKRALKKHMDEVFELIESDVDFKVNTAFKDNEWFNQYVDYRNIALGDDEEFWTVNKVMLVVAEVARSQHDLTIQNIPSGSSFRVHTKNYGVKIGKDIDLIVLGRIDFTELVDKIAEAFVYQVQSMCYTSIYGAAAKLPNNTQFVKTGTPSSATKATFDQLLEDVATANDSDVVIMGTKVALKKLTGFIEPGSGSINWIADSQKEDIASMGRLGNYEGTDMIEIPQRFAPNDVTTKLIDNSMILIFAKNQEKFVKFVDRGETEILEVGTDKGELRDDFHTYEVQREMGADVVLPSYFGRWNI